MTEEIKRDDNDLLDIREAEVEELEAQQGGSAEYDEEDIKTLSWNEHIRLRPGMYIGKLGDGTYNDDGIYVLLKEVLDNSIDEYMMGFGNKITVELEEGTVRVRDFGRGDRKSVV